MVICLERGADLHVVQLIPVPLTVSCSSKIEIGFTFLVTAHPGSPGQRAVKFVCVCVCVCVCVRACVCVCLIPHDVNIAMSEINCQCILYKERQYRQCRKVRHLRYYVMPLSPKRR